MKYKLLDLLRQSVLVQGTIALMLVATVCYQIATGQDVPDLLVAMVSVVLGFYFGQKAQQQANKL